MINFKGTLRRIESNHQNLRTDEVTGTCITEPVVGANFAMIAPPFKEGFLRAVTTSLVQRVVEVSPTKWEFWTRNSHYELEAIDG